MNIKIRSKNFEITPAIDDYVTKRIASLEKFLDIKDATLCEVELGRTTTHHKSGDIFKAEVNLMEPGYKQVFAIAEEVDLYTAIDVVRGETERLIVSQKKKHDTLFRRGAVQVKNLLKRINFKNNK